jgi:hypothetical protein
MKRNLFSILMTIVALSSFGQAIPTYNWTFGVGGVNSESVSSTKVDGAGNVYIAGVFNGTAIDFDPGAGTSALTTLGLNDIFIAKYTNAGAFVWVKQIGTTAADAVNDMAVDSLGNIYIGGSFSAASMDMDPSPAVSNVTNTGGLSAYLAKYSTTGTLVWANAFGGTSTTNSFTTCYSVGCNFSNGDVFMGGLNTDSTVDFDPGVGMKKFPATLIDGYIVRYTTTGACQWINFCLGNFDQVDVNYITVDRFGNPWVGYEFKTPFCDLSISPNGPLFPFDNFNPSPGLANRTFDLLVVGYAKDTGEIIGATQLGSDSTDFIGGIGFDNQGHTYVAGRYSFVPMNLDFWGPGMTIPNAGGQDIFYAKFDDTFGLVKGAGAGSTGNDYCFEMTSDINGNVTMVGAYGSTAGSTLNLNLKGGINTVTSLGAFDGYVVRYDSMANIQGLMNITSATQNYFTTVATKKNIAYVGGIFQGTVDFNPAATTNNFTSNGLSDVSTSKYDMCGTITPVVVNKAICAGSGIMFKGIVRTTAGSWTDTIKQITYCDSIVTLNLTITPNVAASISIATTSTSPLCAGSSVTFTATPTNGGATPVFQWKKNGTNVGGNTTTFTTTISATTDSVWCIMTPSDSCSTPKAPTSSKKGFTITPNVTPTASISASPSNTICSGASVTFSIAPSTNLGTPTYKWYKNGTVVGTSATYTNSTWANGDGIKCLVKSTATCASPDSIFTNQIDMIITPSVTPSIAITGSTSICIGANATFNATISNGGITPVYTWKKNGSVVGSNSNTWSSTALSNNDVITCELTSNANCATSNTATSNSITVQVNTLSLPTVTISASTPNICAGPTNTFFTATPTNGGATPQYQWKVNTFNVGSGGATYSANLNPNDVVTCELTTSSLCATAPKVLSNSLTVLANVSPTVTITPTPSLSICSGETITFTANTTNGGANPTYQWNKNGSPVSGQTGSNYAASNFANNDLITCTLTSNAVCAVPSTLTSTGKSVVILVPSAPAVTIAASPSIACSGANVTFSPTPTNGGASPTYAWKINGNAAGSGATFSSTTLANGDVVSCVLTSSASCATTPNATSNNINMTINPLLTPAVSVASNPSNTVCHNGTITFVATPANGGNTPAYSWTIDAVAQSSSSNIMGKTFTNTGATATTATVIVTMTVGAGVCASSSTAQQIVNVTVNPTLTPIVNIATSSVNICAGTNATFTTTTSGAGATPTFEWTKNGSIVGTNSSTYASNAMAQGDVMHCRLVPTVGGCYTAAEAHSNNITMTVNPNVIPTATINVVPGIQACQGQNIQFSTTATNGGTSPTYVWKVNGNNQSSNSNFAKSDLVNGDVIALTYTSNAQCATPTIVNTNVTMTINPKPATPSIQKLGSTLLQSSITGDSYIWKKNDVLLSTTGKTLSVTSEEAIYTLAVISKGCTSDISVDYFYKNAIQSFDEVGIKVFPNPIVDVFQIELPSSLAVLNNTLTIKSISGANVTEAVEINRTKDGYSVSVSALATGMYIVELENEKGKAIYKINLSK